MIVTGTIFPFSFILNTTIARKKLPKTEKGSFRSCKNKCNHQFDCRILDTTYEIEWWSGICKLLLYWVFMPSFRIWKHFLVLVGVTSLFVLNLDENFSPVIWRGPLFLALWNLELGLHHGNMTGKIPLWFWHFFSNTVCYINCLNYCLL